VNPGEAGSETWHKKKKQYKKIPPLPGWKNGLKGIPVG
jgi:hypothetical protein